MQKKWIAMLTAVLMAGLLFTGCSEPLLNVSTNENNTISVTAEKSLQDSAGIGYLIVGDARVIRVEPELSRGKVQLRVFAGALGSETFADNPTLLKEISGSTPVEFDVVPGEYTIGVKVLEKTDGTALISAPGSSVVDYGYSDIYTREDMDAAVKLIRKEFAGWEGCEMHVIRYGSDDCVTEENLNWLNDLAGGGKFTQCIEFVSFFHSPVETAGTWEPDTEYENWQWWLAREEGGDWQLLSWGY